MNTTITVEQLNDYLRCKLTLPLNLSSSILGNSTDEYVAAPNSVCCNPHNLNKQLGYGYYIIPRVSISILLGRVGTLRNIEFCCFEYFFGP